MFFLVLGIAIIFAGCASQEATTTTTTAAETTTTTTTSTTTTTVAGGVSIQGMSDGIQVSQISSFLIRAFASSEGNPNYEDAYESPTAFGVSAFKCSLLTDESAVDSYIIFDNGSVEAAQYYDLSDETPTIFGSNETSPDAATYSHVGLYMAYIQATFPMDIGDVDNAGYIPHSVRIYASTSGEVQDGDLMIEAGGIWRWVDSTNGTYVTSRPALPVQFLDFASANTPDPYTEVVTLEAPVVIPEDPEGQWVGTFTFDGTDMFFYDDVDSDSKFEPGVLTPNGDRVEGFNQPQWAPSAPAVTCTFEVQ